MSLWGPSCLDVRRCPNLQIFLCYLAGRFPKISVELNINGYDPCPMGYP